MEEVDAIIFHFLNRLDIEISDEINSLADMPVELIIQSVSKCLNTINPSLQVPKNLPPGVSHRIEVAAQIAGFCKDLGYKNDVGYQTFLYCNESDLRQVFMYLIEHLPSEGIEHTKPLLEKSDFLRKVSKKIDEDLNTIWIPQLCASKNKNTTELSINEDKLCKPKVDEHYLIENLLKVKAIKLGNINKCEEDHSHQINEKQDSTEVNESLKCLKEMAVVLQQKLNSLKNERNMMDFEYAQAQKTYQNADGEWKNVLNILNSIGLKATDMDAVVDVLVKAQKSIESLHLKSEELTSKTLAIKLEIDKHRSQNTDSLRSKCRNTLNTLRDNAKALKVEYDMQEQLRDQLKKSYGKSRSGNKRSIYTKRILEIISNVDKQNLEIKKVLDDTKEMQREINALEGQLDRCFSIADETLFRDAKKDDQAKKAYKLLALLHSECNTIVSLINETGILEREIVDLEDNIKAEKIKRTEDTLERIKLDLTRMQEESA